MSDGPSSAEPPHEDRERALAALRRWREGKPWARVDPAARSIAEVIPCGPVQAILTSHYESRGVRYELEPAPSRPARNEEGPDPWGVKLEQRRGAPVGAEVSTPISGTTVHMDCGLCSGIGDMTCPTCDGTGTVQTSQHHAKACYRCAGSGEITCTQCRGSGGMLGHPTVWSRIEEARRVRVHEPSELPLAVFLDLQDTDHGGEVIHEEEAERIVDLRRGGGYRDAASADDPMRALVQTVAVEHGVPEDGRILRQRLEIRRVSAYEVRLTDGRRLWVYGDPPAVEPAKALASFAARAARVAPLLAAALGLLGWALWTYGL